MRSEFYMQQAMILALKGKGAVSPNPMVGAVIVKNNKVIATGYHARCGGDHAEVAALNEAGKKARGATLYVTLEPCAHYGRTPPCVKRILESGIAKVVVGMRDPNPLMNGRSLVLLKKAGVEIEEGFLTKELSVINEVFIKYIKERVPFVTAKIAQTIDGKIATATGESKWITTESTRDFARRRRDDYDAIMVGANTVIADDPELNPYRSGKRLKKIVVDSTLKVPATAKLYRQTKPDDVIIATTKKAKSAKIETFSRKGMTMLVAPSAGRSGHVSLQWLIKELGRMQIASVLIEGGGRLIGGALKEGIVDKMSIYIAPKLVGDADALAGVSGVNIKTIKDLIRLKDTTMTAVDPDYLLEGYVHRDR